VHGLWSRTIYGSSTLHRRTREGGAWVGVTWPGLPWPAGGGNGQGSEASVSVERSPCWGKGSQRVSWQIKEGAIVESVQAADRSISRGLLLFQLSPTPATRQKDKSDKLIRWVELWGQWQQGKEEREGIIIAFKVYLLFIEPTWKCGKCVRSGGYFRESIWHRNWFWRAQIHLPEVVWDESPTSL
jgi:hypothetical protein